MPRLKIPAVDLTAFGRKLSPPKNWPFLPLHEFIWLQFIVDTQLATVAKRNEEITKEGRGSPQPYL
jgi:hypothetical protein